MPVPHAGAPGQLGRRRFLTLSTVGLAAAATACTASTALPSAVPTSAAEFNLPAAIQAREAQRRRSGRTARFALTAAPTQIDLGGPVVSTWAYNDTVPGPLIRANVGDQLQLTVRNLLPDPTSLHSHGVAMRNDMDGVQPASADIAATAQHTYSYTVPSAGTYWAHPHVGIQTDYGLYAPMVFDDPREVAAYDAEWVVVLDDWLDGTGTTPKRQLADLQAGRAGMRSPQPSGPGAAMPGMSMPSPSTPSTPSGSTGMGGMAVGRSALLGGDAGDVSYRYYLVNGRVPAAPPTFAAKPGQRIRIRIVNAAADTAFRVALAGHTMTVTHTDGYPTVPYQVDALLIGMAERYDVIVTLADGVFPLVASAEGKNAVARGLIRTAAGEVPPATWLPPQLNGRIGTAPLLRGDPAVALPSGVPDVELTATLAGAMMPYRWTINGTPYDRTVPLETHQGQRVRLLLTNDSDMWHPMHLHGHTFQLVRPDQRQGVRKDTVIVKPRTTVPVDLIADNPGVWLLHCHNGYHSESGMMTRLQYTR